MRRWLSSWFALGCALIFCGSVRAEPPAHALESDAQSHRLWIRGIGYFGEQAGARVLSMAPRFGGAFLLGDFIDLDVEVPFAFARVKTSASEADAAHQDELETRTMVANPFIGLSYVAELRGSLFTAGLGGTVPLARDDTDDPYDDLAFALARAARGGRESWLYVQDRVSVVIQSAFETHVPHGPLVGVDAAVAIMPRVRSEGARLASTSQLGLSLAAVLSESVRLGGRIDTVLLSVDEPERLQAALVPFLRVSSRDGVLFALELTVNLDDPFGFAFVSGGLWGLSLSAGSRF